LWWCATPRTGRTSVDPSNHAPAPDVVAQMSSEPTGFVTVEHQRLAQAASGTVPWKRWGPYLSERQWGTVREDYSADGNAWNYLPHDQARSKAYRWGEDGLLGISDDHQLLCFALALWNGHDPILKERLFGLTGPQGNHGEDVKEVYYYLDSTPTHSWLVGLYKYPQRAFPYLDLVDTNARRGRSEPEYELIDTGVFSENRYFDVLVEYAKTDAEDVLVQISVTNHGPEPAPLHVLPTLWFRNTWSWPPDIRWGQTEHPAEGDPPSLRRDFSAARVLAEHARLGRYVLDCDTASTAAGVVTPDFLFTDNETNAQRLYQTPNATRFVKDGIDDAVVNGKASAVNLDGSGTRAAAHYVLSVAAGETVRLRLRLRKDDPAGSPGAPFERFDELHAARRADADAFYAALQPTDLAEDDRHIQRQAFAGLLWNKQFYRYNIQVWLHGDAGFPPPPPDRERGRNHDWRHLNAADVMSMPDSWEYPWFASWDLAFHCLPLTLLDPVFAKEQLSLLMRERMQHPNGDVPAYEWAFGDVNPPVLAWATLRVFQIELSMTGKADFDFLARMFHKLLLSFTWWVNRKDVEGNNIFEGGFLGLDNLGVFDWNAPDLPLSGFVEQSDGTSWMAMFCLNMLTIAVELALQDDVYQDMALKFFDHFVRINVAMNHISEDGISLWDDEDGFFYDVLRLPNSEPIRLAVRSMVGLIPLFAVVTGRSQLLEGMPELVRGASWLAAPVPSVAELVKQWVEPSQDGWNLLAIVHGNRLRAVLRRMLDEQEFLSPHGIRALSRYHAEHPYTLQLGAGQHTVDYEPAESRTAMFGGNSNWRGPVWFPVNYLIVESLLIYHRYYGDALQVEYPTGSGHMCSLAEVAQDLSDRLVGLFRRGPDGRRPIFGDAAIYQQEPAWRDHLLFYEYFHGDNGAGLGASHQTGWTGLVAMLLQGLELGRYAAVVPLDLGAGHDVDLPPSPVPPPAARAS
jgi:hypothetical protein